MMRRRRRIGGGDLVIAMVVLGVVCSGADAAVYNVGDAAGWTFSVLGWENRKRFKAGDTLVFKYDTALHSVAKVDKASFDACRVPANAPTLKSGNDKIVLQRGPNYFICGTLGHCWAGMKISAFTT